MAGQRRKRTRDNRKRRAEKIIHVVFGPGGGRVREERAIASVTPDAGATTSTSREPVTDLFTRTEVSRVVTQEVRRFLPQISPYGLILMHDASSHLKLVREAALKLEAEGLISVVLSPTPRGLVVAQKKRGRK